MEHCYTILFAPTGPELELLVDRSGIQVPSWSMCMFEVGSDMRVDLSCLWPCSIAGFILHRQEAKLQHLSGQTNLWLWPGLAVGIASTGLGSSELGELIQR